MKPDYKNWIPKEMLFLLIAETVLSLALLLVFGVFGIGVKNASFQRGNAVKLDFPDESFDAVTSNYVYHNITGADKQALLLETLRVLKKGGTFAIHDLMSPRRYGDMQAFVQKLRDMGYERVELIDTTDGSFMTPKEAKRLMLRGSTLLVGRK